MNNEFKLLVKEALEQHIYLNKYANYRDYTNEDELEMAKLTAILKWKQDKYNEIFGECHG